MAIEEEKERAGAGAGSRNGPRSLLLATTLDYILGGFYNLSSRIYCFHLTYVYVIVPYCKLHACTHTTFPYIHHMLMIAAKTDTRFDHLRGTVLPTSSGTLPRLTTKLAYIR